MTLLALNNQEQSVQAESAQPAIPLQFYFH